MPNSNIISEPVVWCFDSVNRIKDGPLNNCTNSISVPIPEKIDRIHSIDLVSIEIPTKTQRTLELEWANVFVSNHTKRPLGCEEAIFKTSDGSNISIFIPPIIIQLSRSGNTFTSPATSPHLLEYTAKEGVRLSPRLIIAGQEPLDLVGVNVINETSFSIPPGVDLGGATTTTAQLWYPNADTIGLLEIIREQLRIKTGGRVVVKIDLTGKCPVAFLSCNKVIKVNTVGAIATKMGFRVGQNLQLGIVLHINVSMYPVRSGNYDETSWLKAITDTLSCIHLHTQQPLYINEVASLIPAGKYTPKTLARTITLTTPAGVECSFDSKEKVYCFMGSRVFSLKLPQQLATIMGFQPDVEMYGMKYYKSLFRNLVRQTVPRYECFGSTYSSEGKLVIQLRYPSNNNPGGVQISNHSRVITTESHVLQVGDLVGIRVGQDAHRYVTITSNTIDGYSTGFEFKALDELLPVRPSVYSCDITYQQEMVDSSLIVTTPDGKITLRSDGGGAVSAIITQGIIRFIGDVSDGVRFTSYEYPVTYRLAGRPFLHIFNASTLRQCIRPSYIGMKPNSFQPLYVDGVFISPVSVYLEVDSYILIQLRCNQNESSNIIHQKNQQSITLIAKVRKSTVPFEMSNSYPKQVTLPVPSKLSQINVQLLNPDHTLYEMQGVDWGMTLQLNSREYTNR